MVPGANEERGRGKSQMRHCGRRERERKREVDLTGNINTPSFPIQLLAASPVQN